MTPRCTYCGKFISYDDAIECSSIEYVSSFSFDGLDVDEVLTVECLKCQEKTKGDKQ